jgi:hypothetical protein
MAKKSVTKLVPIKIDAAVYARLQAYKAITGRTIAHTASAFIKEMLDVVSDTHIETLSNGRKH